MPGAQETMQPAPRPQGLRGYSAPAGVDGGHRPLAAWAATSQLPQDTPRSPARTPGVIPSGQWLGFEIIQGRTQQRILCSDSSTSGQVQGRRDAQAACGGRQREGARLCEA